MSEPFTLKRYKDRPVTIGERRALLDEIERLRERLGPRGLEVVEINGTGHYVNKKVRAEIERLRSQLVKATEVIRFAQEVTETSCIQRGTRIDNPTPDSLLGRTRAFLAETDETGK